MQQIHAASKAHAIAVEARSAQARALSRVSQDGPAAVEIPIHGMHALPEVWHACEALALLTEVRSPLPVSS